MTIKLKREKEVLKELLGYLPSGSTISRLRAREQLPPSFTIGRTRYVDLCILEDWLRGKRAVQENNNQEKTTHSERRKCVIKKS